MNRASASAGTGIPFPPDSREMVQAPHPFQVIWKESGWGTIIILAALAGDQSPTCTRRGDRRRQPLAADVAHHPAAIRSTIVILLILRLGSVMDTGFEQIFLMLNPFTMEVGNVLDTYVYFKGIQQGDISFATAVGLSGAVGLILVVIANRLAKRFGEGGMY